ncbi:MAG: acetamidase/formamidase family protein [Dehalococcoidia bacterium]|jgi:acetamidase/formamidase|nr:acetamidase/formamidase family protein [Dehalococcoidia bacterium]
MSKVHEVVATTYYRTFSRFYPVLAHIEPGDTVVTKALDSGGQDLNGKHLSESGNPLTGPFFIEGAEPGDSISVDLKKVRLNRNWGYTSYRLGLVSMTPAHVVDVYSSHYEQDLVRTGRADMLPWDIDLERNTVRARNPKSKTKNLEFDALPMLGCIGVAPAGDFTPTSGPSGPYGGNIDYNQVREGATVHLPVYQPGALLYLGDGHALQADGEPLGTGIETSMDIEFSVSLHKGRELTGPRVENESHISSVGSQPEFSSSLNVGLQMATSDMAAWLTADHGFEDWAAHQLIGMVGIYDVVTVAGSVALRIPKANLP